ncbi:actin nucleation-promoting factor WAS-like isoform X2 [Neofelis nebulosa]|uniref:actin nucleation-promoting factor WAS-like isoform X2 n=1 Tax=Neofelis nebulosa TaxID=61452 RepID=UPI00272C6E4D|nr:actin nucleation-promoting factor WAS-like isoform X2 [Neofelis nebulosa]
MARRRRRRRLLARLPAPAASPPRAPRTRTAGEEGGGAGAEAAPRLRPPRRRALPRAPPGAGPRPSPRPRLPRGSPGARGRRGLHSPRGRGGGAPGHPPHPPPPPPPPIEFRKQNADITRAVIFRLLTHVKKQPENVLSSYFPQKTACHGPSRRRPFLRPHTWKRSLSIRPSDASSIQMSCHQPSLSVALSPSPPEGSAAA